MSGVFTNRSGRVSPTTSDPPPKIQIHVSTGGIVTMSSGFKLNDVKVEGDICMINREGNKRRLETRMTKKTIIIMTPFILLRIVFLGSTVLKRLITGDIYTRLLMFYLHMVLVCVSFLSCLFNSLTFILLTPILKDKSKLFLRNLKTFFIRRK